MRDSEALRTEAEKIATIDTHVSFDSKCTMKKRDEWLAGLRKALAEVRSQIED